MYKNSHYSMFSVEVLKAMGHPVCLGCNIAHFCCIIFFSVKNSSLLFLNTVCKKSFIQCVYIHVITL